MRCPNCSNKVIQKSGSATKLRITGAVEFNDAGQAHAQCYWCKARIELPVALKKAAEDEERFVIQTRKPVA